MMTAARKYLQKYKTRHGKTIYYFRGKDGVRIRLLAHSMCQPRWRVC